MSKIVSAALDRGQGLDFWSQGRGHSDLGSRPLEAEAWPRGLHHYITVIF